MPAVSDPNNAEYIAEIQSYIPDQIAARGDLTAYQQNKNLYIDVEAAVFGRQESVDSKYYLVTTNQSTGKPEEIFLQSGQADIPQFEDIIILEDRSVQYAALDCGYVDAIAANETDILQYMTDYGADFRILDEPLLITGIGAAFSVDDDRGLAQELMDTFAQMRQDGTMQEIVGRYLEHPETYLEVECLEP